MTVKILLVDDFPALLEFLHTYFNLECRKVEIVECTSALTGLEHVKRQKFDIIISDYAMRDMNGIEFLKNIRGMGNSIPFILFTAIETPEIKSNAQKYGAMYIQKGEHPIENFEKIITVLRTMKKNITDRDSSPGPSG